MKTKDGRSVRRPIRLGDSTEHLMQLEGRTKKQSRVQKSHHYKHRANMMIARARRENGTPSYSKLYGVSRSGAYKAAMEESIRAESAFHGEWGSALGSDARLHGTDRAYEYTPVKPKKERSSERTVEKALQALFG